jgi:hypothetical protein
MKKTFIGIALLSFSHVALADMATTYIINASNKNITANYQVCTLTGTGPSATCGAAQTIQLEKNGTDKSYQVIQVGQNQYIQMASAIASSSNVITNFKNYSCASATYTLNSNSNLGSMILTDYNVPNKVFCVWNAS